MVQQHVCLYVVANVSAFAFFDVPYCLHQKEALANCFSTTAEKVYRVNPSYKTYHSKLYLLKSGSTYTQN